MPTTTKSITVVQSSKAKPHPAVTSALKAVIVAEDSLRAVDLRTVPRDQRVLHMDARTSLGDAKRFLRVL